jgi:PAS domain-containing protein
MFFRRSDKKKKDQGKVEGEAATGERGRERENQFKIELMPGVSDQARSYLAGDFKLNGSPGENGEVESTSGDPGIDIIVSRVIEPAQVDYSKSERLRMLLQTKQEEIERLKSERLEMEAKETLYYASFHSLPLPLIMISPHTLGIIDVNAAASSLLGIWRNQLVERSLREMIPEDARPSFETFLVSLISDNSSMLSLKLKLSATTSKKLSFSGAPIMFSSRLIGYLLRLEAIV